MLLLPLTKMPLYCSDGYQPYDHPVLSVTDSPGQFYPSGNSLARIILTDPYQTYYGPASSATVGV